MADKVAILGTVPNSRQYAPYNDGTWDIWCCSAGNSQQAAPPRVTEWFELHSINDLQAAENQNWYPAYATWLRTLNIPVWMQEKNTDVPKASVFPWRELTERFGPNKAGKTNWFTSSPAWMFAFAIQRGYKTIGVFGVDMAAAEEHYTGQKAGLLRWFEIGRELGIEVIVPLESTLAFHYPLYGYAEASRHGRALLVREHELKARLQHFENNWRQQERDIYYTRGALEQVVFDRRTYVSGYNDAEVSEEAYAADFGREYGAHLPAKPLHPHLPKPPMAVPTPMQSVSGGWTPSQIQNAAPPSADDFATPDAELLVAKKRKANGPVPKEGV